MSKFLMKQICLGVQYLHKNGWIHCDLKLDNFLYDEETKICKIIDFEFVRRVQTTNIIQQNTLTNNNNGNKLNISNKLYFSNSSTSSNSSSSLFSSLFSFSSRSSSKNKNNSSSSSISSFTSSPISSFHLSSSPPPLSITSTEPSLSPSPSSSYLSPSSRSTPFSHSPSSPQTSELFQLKIGTLSYSSPELREYSITNSVDESQTSIPTSTSTSTTKSILTTKVDIWSLGVSLFALLTSHFPFTESELLLFNEKLIFPNEIFFNFSKDCKSLIEFMLKKNQSSRFDIEKVLKHSWLKNVSNSSSLSLLSSSPSTSSSSSSSSPSSSSSSKKRMIKI